MIINTDRQFYRPAKQIQFFPELHQRLEGETISQWCARHKKVTGKAPDTEELRLSPFYHVVTPMCTTAEKYRWCVRMFGLDGFMEYCEPHNFPVGQQKVWLFNEDFDAVQFKLAWLDQQEAALDETVRTTP